MRVRPRIRPGAIDDTEPECSSIWPTADVLVPSPRQQDFHSVSCRTVRTGASLVRKTLSVTLPSR